MPEGKTCGYCGAAIPYRRFFPREYHSDLDCKIELKRRVAELEGALRGRTISCARCNAVDKFIHDYEYGTERSSEGYTAAMGDLVSALQSAGGKEAE